MGTLQTSPVKRALLLGTHSFIDGGSKVGMQHLAEGLARRGWEVDYVATASSPFDLWGRQRHARLRRVWFGRQSAQGVSIEQGLKEYAFKALFPAHKLLLRSAWQFKTYTWLAPAWLSTREYTLCLHETSPNVLYFPPVRAQVRIFRLADWPDGFAHDLHPVLIHRFAQLQRTSAYDEIWAVSQPLADYARALNPSNRIITLPNGVETIFQAEAASVQRQAQSAVFVGGFSAWMDMELVHRSAELLPNWAFNLYGPGTPPVSAPPSNVHYHPPVPRQQVPELLARHEVGLLPLKNSHGRMRFVERPLKFYEYISAGLGVASTDIGGLRQGMGELACYGNSPAAFADAIRRAAECGHARPAEFNQHFMAQHSWPVMVDQALQRLDALLQGKA